MSRDDDRFTVLTQSDRQSLTWNTPPSRRRTIPTFSNSLSRADVRERRCSTCRRVFNNIHDLKKHVDLTHTGMKPVVCEICGKRFERESHMLSHYEMHKEPRLQEFAILTKRRQVRSEPPLSPSQTTVGSFHGVPRKLRDFNVPESTKSFGTKQTFHISEKKKERRKGAPSSIEDDYQGSGTEIEKSSKMLPDLIPKFPLPKNAQTRSKSITETDTKPEQFPKVKQSLPRIDPESISVIDSVTGANVAIETSQRSGFVSQSEDSFMRSRMKEIELAGYSSRQNSRQTGSGSLLQNLENSRQKAMNRLSSGSTMISRAESMVGNRNSGTRLNSSASNFTAR